MIDFVSNKPHYENVPFEIPESWEWCRLGDVCQIFGRIGFRGYTKNDLVESNGAITLSPSNISNGKMDYSKCTYISWYKYEESPEIQIFDGDIILVKTGSSYGKCALVENLPKKATINPQFVTLKHIHIEPKLLTYILQSSYARMNYDNFVLGTAIPTFTQVALSDMLIPIMSINEQQRIISAIERWFAVIDELEANKEELKKYIQQIKAKVLDLAIHGKLVPQDPNDEPAIELLKRINPNFKPCDTSHYENLPSGWSVVQLCDIAKTVTGSTPSKNNKSYYGGTFPLYKPSDLDAGRNVNEASEYLSDEGKRISRIIPANSIAVCCIGSIGKCGYIMREGTTNQQINTIIPLYNIYPLYIYYFCLSASFVQQLLEKSSAVTIAIVNKSKLDSTFILLPPLVEQKRIADQIEIIFASLDTITAEL